MAVVSPPAIITLTIRDEILQSKTQNWLTDLKSKIKKYTLPAKKFTLKTQPGLKGWEKVFQANDNQEEKGSVAAPNLAFSTHRSQINNTETGAFNSQQVERGTQ